MKRREMGAGGIDQNDIGKVTRGQASQFIAQTKHRCAVGIFGHLYESPPFTHPSGDKSAAHRIIMFFVLMNFARIFWDSWLD